MKMIRISTISLVLGLAGAMTAAWGAESVMNLISSGEALQKEVRDNKAASEAAETHDRQLAVEGRELAAQQSQLTKDVDTWKKENDGIKSRTDDYNTRCGGGPDKHLTQDQFKACTADKDQLNADIAKVNAENADLNKRNTELNQKIPAYNAETHTSGPKVQSTFADYNASLKKEGAWLDQARTEMSSDDFKSYGKKAGCPDVSKNPKSTDAMIKMADDVIACLKKVSST